MSAREPAGPPANRSWSVLVVAAAIVGAGAGALGAAFRRCLTAADDARGDLVEWADGPLRSVLVVVVVAAAIAASVWLVRRFAPRAAGSGIPDVERVLLHERAEPKAIAVPVKFVAGTLSIGGGLALGREGPTVQMGAIFGNAISRFGRRWPEPETLLAAGASAGLAAAFNAPLAGALFVVEELLHRFSPRLLAAALVASATSIVVLRASLGDDVDLPTLDVVRPSAWGQLAVVVLGLLAGVLGVAFNRGLLRTMDLVDAWRRIPPVVLAAAFGAVVGLVALASPRLVGSGYPLAQEALTGHPAVATMAGILAARFALTIGSYAIGAAGGLFAPLLVLGAELGRLLGDLAHELAPGAVPDASALAIAGMAAVFVASVRVPVTAIVLILELTGASPLILSVVLACGIAYVVATALGDEPIYDALRTRHRPQPA